MAAVLFAAVWYIRGYLRPVAHVAAAVEGAAIDSVSASVLVVATRPGELKSEIGGKILMSVMDPGKVVKEGEVLAQIDTGDIDLEIDKTKIDLEVAKRKLAAGSSIKFEYETAKENLENSERTYQRGGMAPQVLAQQKRLVEQVKFKLDQDEQQLTAAAATLQNTLATKERQRGKMTITAPFDGVITSVIFRKDDQVGNSQIIGNMITLTRAVEAKISEENFSKIELGQRAIVHFLSYGDQQYEAKVTKKLPTSEAGTGRYVAHLEVNIPPEKLLPDLTGDATIIVASRQAKTKIPRRAYFDGYVYVVTDGTVERRAVKLGYSALNVAEVLQGLKTGEMVIVDELDQFHEGQKVRTVVDTVER